MGEEIAVPKGETVKIAGTNVTIRTCGYMREYLVPESKDELEYEVVYNFIALMVDGKEREMTTEMGVETAVVDNYQITFVAILSEPEIMCTVIIDRME